MIQSLIADRPASIVAADAERPGAPLEAAM
jgi:hypothetical protein